MSDETPRYPVVRFLVRHGKIFAIGLSLLAPLLGIYLALVFDNWIFLAGGAVAGGILYVILESYVEIVRIIADMLLAQNEYR